MRPARDSGHIPHPFLRHQVHCYAQTISHPPRRCIGQFPQYNPTHTHEITPPPISFETPRLKVVTFPLRFLPPFAPRRLWRNAHH